MSLRSSLCFTVLLHQQPCSVLKDNVSMLKSPAAQAMLTRSHCVLRPLRWVRSGGGRRSVARLPAAVAHGRLPNPMAH